MVKPIEIIDRDLSEPVEDPSAGINSGQRSLQVFRGIAIFISIYSILHKLIIPALLKLTPLRSSLYAGIDLWALPIGLWLGLLWFRRGPDQLLNLLSGAFIAHGVVSSYEVFFTTSLRGWLLFSHLLSSWPLAFCAIAFFSLAEKQFRPRWAITGFLGTLVIASVTLLLHEEFQPQADRRLERKNYSIATELPNAHCGAQTLSFTRKSMIHPSAVNLENCGFSPSSVELPVTGRIQIANLRERSVNIHFYVKKSKGFSSSWNVLVEAGKTIQSPLIHLDEGEVGIIFSDAYPLAGMTAVLKKQSFTTQSRWRFSRLPLKVEKFDEL